VAEIIVEINPAVSFSIPVYQDVIPADIPMLLAPFMQKTDGFYALDEIVQNFGKMLVKIGFMIYPGGQFPDMIGKGSAVYDIEDSDDIGLIIPNRKNRA
jgi:hypothetical protein